MLIFIFLAYIKDFFVICTLPDVYRCVVIRIIFMTTAATFECFQSTTGCIQVSTYRTYLAGKVRRNLHKVITLPVQCLISFCWSLPLANMENFQFMVLLLLNSRISSFSRTVMVFLFNPSR